MKPSNLKASVRAGLIKHNSDGVHTWSRKSIEGLISPRGFKNSLSDVEILNMLAELEAEGLIKIVGGNATFIEVLNPVKAEDLLVEKTSLSSLQELVKLLEDLDANFLRPGLLVQIEGDCSVEQILRWHSTKKSLPDLINIVFETIPGQTRYLLSCDTYHGGGVFGRMYGSTEGQVILSPRLLELVEQAIQAVDQDIEARRVSSSTYDDLLAIRKELTEIQNGKREDFSEGLIHMMADSMSWDQPCRKAFRPVSDALYRATRRKRGV